MNNVLFCTYGISQATQYAAEELKKMGYVFCNSTGINEATHLLTDTPITFSTLPDNIHKGITIIGGRLDLPYSCLDLLEDPVYLAKNAMITAHCAIKIAMQSTNYILPDQSVLVIGWGRIGKCLAYLLKSIGCQVTVAARNLKDRAMLTALGYQTCETSNLQLDLYKIIFTTVPHLLIENYDAQGLVIDLASTPGIKGPNVISARGLPGKEAPASSGKLIAETIHRLLTQKE